MDSNWLDVNEYTPSSPEGLQVSVDTRRDETGHLHPVLVANWRIKDEGESVCRQEEKTFSLYYSSDDVFSLM